MGDRSNIYIQQHKAADGTWDGIGLYAHWHGTTLHDVALEGVEKGRNRIGDPSYFARIVIHHVLHSIADPNSELGFGLWSDQPCDNEHPILVINAQTGECWLTGEGCHRLSRSVLPARV